eukprot:4873135-Pleurochrysis_carterae.AAC.1
MPTHDAELEHPRRQRHLADRVAHHEHCVCDGGRHGGNDAGVINWPQWARIHRACNGHSRLDSCVRRRDVHCRFFWSFNGPTWQAHTPVDAPASAGPLSATCVHLSLRRVAPRQPPHMRADRRHPPYVLCRRQTPSCVCGGLPHDCDHSYVLDPR